jgi:hypothetical protein
MFQTTLFGLDFDASAKIRTAESPLCLSCSNEAAIRFCRRSLCRTRDMSTSSRRIDGFRLDCGQAVRTLPAAFPMLLASTILMMSSIVVIAMLSIDIARTALT